MLWTVVRDRCIDAMTFSRVSWKRLIDRKSVLPRGVTAVDLLYYPWIRQPDYVGVSFRTVPAHLEMNQEHARHPGVQCRV